ncbi:MAG: hypothetical protein ACE5E1_07915 [Phycisphaerae bacterium]
MKTRTIESRPCLRLRLMVGGLIFMASAAAMAASAATTAAVRPPDDDDASARESQRGTDRGPLAGPRGRRRGRFSPPDDRPRGRHRWSREERPAEPSPRMIEEAMRILARELPEWHDRLAKLRTRNPRRFRQAVRKFLPIFREYMSLRERDPALAGMVIAEFKIEEQLRQLGRRYAAVPEDAPEREEMDRMIEELVKKQAEFRMRRREARLRDFKERLERQQERLRHEIQKFEEEKEHLPELVAERIAQVKRGGFRGPPGPRDDHGDFLDKPRHRRNREDHRRPPLSGPRGDDPPEDRDPG